MDTSNIKKTFYSSVGAIIFAAFAGTVGMVVDGIFIGRFLGDTAMAAFGLASPIFLLGNTLGGLIASGVSAVCSRKIGACDKEGAQKTFQLSLMVMLIIALFSMGLIFFFAGPISKVLGANTVELFSFTKEYLLGLLLWIPTSFFMLTMQPVMQLDDDKALIFVSTLVTTVVDILLDIVFIRFFDGGMYEMALATSISYTIGILVYIIHFRKKNIIFKLRLGKGTPGDLKDITIYGVPTATQRFSGTIRTYALNRIAVILAGSFAVTALSVQSNMYNIFSSVGLGISMTTLTFTSVLFGEKNQKGIRELMQTALIAAVLMNSAVAVILYLLAPMMVKLYLGANTNTFTVCLDAVRLFSLSLPFHAVSNVYVSYFQATGKLKHSNSVTFLNDFLYTFICAIILGKLFGAKGIFLSFFVGRLLTMITIYLMFAVEKKHLPKRFIDIL